MEIERGIGTARPLAGRAWPPRLRVAPESATSRPPRADRVPVLVVAASAALGAGLEAWLAGAGPGWEVEVAVLDGAALPVPLPHGLALVVATIPAGGESLIFAIRDVQPGVPVLALADRRDALYEAALLRAGATGAVGAQASRSELVGAARDLVAGRSVMSAEALRLMAQGPPAAPRLTGRQREVLKLVVEGRTTTEIAQELVIAQSTVKTHIARLAMRLGVSGRDEMRRSAAALLATGPAPSPTAPPEVPSDARR